MPFAGPITFDGAIINHLSLTGVSTTVPFNGGRALLSLSVGLELSV